MELQDTVRTWLCHRVDQHSREAIEGLLRTLTEDLAIAVGEAVTLRELSDDGLTLAPVAVCHLDPVRGEAMNAVMGQTVDKADRGLWVPVLEQRAPKRWQVPAGHIPAEASPTQSEFLRQHPIRAILAVPLIWNDRVLGGLSVVRFSVDRPFTDDDEAIATECGKRMALTLDYKRIMTGMNMVSRRSIVGGPFPEA